MLTEKRKYQFIGELKLQRSHVLAEQLQPKDDRVNWLFLNLEKHQYSFVYKIADPLEAKYGVAFKVCLSFTMIEVVSKKVMLQHEYKVLRGQELIGTVMLISSLE